MNSLELYEIEVKYWNSVAEWEEEFGMEYPY